MQKSVYGRLIENRLHLDEYGQDTSPKKLQILFWCPLFQLCMISTLTVHVATSAVNKYFVKFKLQV